MARSLSPYVDPLDKIWLAAARRLGLSVRRDASAYASSDGKGTMLIAPREHLDADDCLAQIILHELCHSLVQGENSFGLLDWGLECDEKRAGYEEEGRTREHACLRLQAALLLGHGLRRLLAPTTDFRPFYDALPPHPLTGPGGDASIRLAREALGRARRAPYAGVLEEALRRTAAIHRVVSESLDDGQEEEAASLWHDAKAPPLHPTGLPLGADEGLRCGDCAWRFEERGASRCRRARSRIERDWPACVFHEARLECQRCAACCRDAYDLVLVGKREKVVRSHPHLVEADGKLLSLRRSQPNNWCAALLQPEEGAYTCTIYEERPRPCRDFPKGGDSCLAARRRVGLSL